MFLFDDSLPPELSTMTLEDKITCASFSSCVYSGDKV